MAGNKNEGFRGIGIPSNLFLMETDLFLRGGEGHEFFRRVQY